jgi:hypothetical protein
MTCRKIKVAFLCLFVFSFCSTGFGGKIVYPWRSTTAIVLSGESFEVWFDADNGQTVNSIQLVGPYNTVNPAISVAAGNWEYDPMSGNRYDTRIMVTVPANAPADRYDLVLKTSSGDQVSYGGVKIAADYKADYYIMHISDGHLYQSGYVTETLLARKSVMIDIANIMDVQIIIETGDNMYNVRNHPEREVDYFLGNEALATKGMAKASAATFLTPGDHDAYAANDWPQSTAQVNADFFNDYWGMQNHCFKYGNGRFMTLNNAWAVSASSAGDHTYQIDQAVAWLGGAGSGGNFFLTAGHCYDKMHGAIDDYKPLNLVLAGDKHHVRTDNPWPFDTGSAEVAYIAGSIRDHFEFNLYKVNNSAGTFTTPSGATGVANVLYSGSQDTPSTWVPNLELSYSQFNDGKSSVNSATIVNRYSFPISGARVRFVMPPGSAYVVSRGVIKQAFDGNSFHIVDVSVELNANSTTTIEILPYNYEAEMNYEAEDFTAASGCVAATNHAGYTGTGFVDMGGSGTWFEWNTINGGTDGGSCRLTFRYASGSNRPCAISVNGVPAGTVNFANTGGWETWLTDTVEIALNSGMNTIRVMATDASGPNVDHMKVSDCALADFNCDGMVDVDDLLYMTNVWLTGNFTADIAKPADGIVDLLDFSIVSQQWLQ